MKIEDFLESLTESEQKIYHDLIDFEQNAYYRLSEGKDFDVFPTENMDGKPISQEQYRLLDMESKRNNLLILYILKLRNQLTIINPKTLKVMIRNDEMH